MAKSWEQFGKRVLAARKESGLTQQELAAELNLDRTAVTRIETGLRAVDSLELAHLARVLRRPIGWFVTDPPPSVVSRRAGRDELVRREDVQLETIAQDVEQLIGLGVLQPPSSPAASIASLSEAEAVALSTREAAGYALEEPAWDLVSRVERLGLYAFVLELERGASASADGSYIALARGGVALLGNAGDSGRRRFTLLHELGHHVLADEFAAEWVVGVGATDREKVINAFAIHFILPRPAAERSWQRLSGARDPRDAAIRIAVEFGVSWSAACAQLNRVGCLSEVQYEQLLHQPPTRFDLVERELSIRSDVDAPAVPPGYAAAVIRALRKAKIGPARAIELLHGTLSEQDLPHEKALSLDAITADLDVLPD